MVALRDTATLAEQAYVFGYPLVLSARSMAQAPAVNQFLHDRDTPDTVHSCAWVDLGDEPVVLSVSPARGRYYVLWLHDAWNALFASIGPRTTGAEPRIFALLGPGRHRAPLPPGLTPVACPTRIMHVTGRLEAVGERDEDALRWAREGFELRPLSGHRLHPQRTEAIDLAPPVEQVERLDGHSFFSEVTRLAVDNPPGPIGSAMLDRLLALATAPEALGEVERGVFRGRAAVRSEARQAVGEPVGPWRVFYDSGGDRLRLAGAARAGLEADAAADALRAVVDRDAAGLPLTGSSRYVLRFPPDSPPPVHGFWSLTSRAGAGAGAAHSISDLRGLALDADGALTIHIQHVAPRRGRRSNWLPAPPGRFDLTLDLYWPGEAALQRRWLPPSLTRVD